MSLEADRKRQIRSQGQESEAVAYFGSAGPELSGTTFPSLLIRIAFVVPSKAGSFGLFNAPVVEAAFTFAIAFSSFSSFFAMSPKALVAWVFAVALAVFFAPIVEVSFFGVCPFFDFGALDFFAPFPRVFLLPGLRLLLSPRAAFSSSIAFSTLSNHVPDVIRR